MITLYGLGPAHGLPDASPLVMGAAGQLALAGLAFVRTDGADLVAADGEPVIVDGDALVAGAAAVRAHAEQRAGIDLDAGLGARERAMAAVIARMIEADLHPLASGAPASATEVAATAARAARVVDALEALLGAGRYLLGDRPTAVDAAAAAGLALAAAPGLDTPLRARIEGSPRLSRYLGRTMRRFHRDHPWFDGRSRVHTFVCAPVGSHPAVERAAALMAHL